MNVEGISWDSNERNQIGDEPGVILGFPLAQRKDERDRPAASFCGIPWWHGEKWLCTSKMPENERNKTKDRNRTNGFDLEAFEHHEIPCALDHNAHAPLVKAQNGPNKIHGPVNSHHLILRMSCNDSFFSHRRFGFLSLASVSFCWNPTFPFGGLPYTEFLPIRLENPTYLSVLHAIYFLEAFQKMGGAALGFLL